MSMVLMTQSLVSILNLTWKFMDFATFKLPLKITQKCTLENKPWKHDFRVVVSLLCSPGLPWFLQLFSSESISGSTGVLRSSYGTRQSLWLHKELWGALLCALSSPLPTLHGRCGVCKLAFTCSEQILKCSQQRKSSSPSGNDSFYRDIEGMEVISLKIYVPKKWWWAKKEYIFPLYFYPSLLPGMLRSFQSCLALCDSMDCSPSGSSVHGILQARILEWVAISSSRRSFWPRDQTHISYVSCIGVLVLYLLKPPRKPFCVWQDFPNICEAQNTGTNKSLDITCLNILNFKSNQESIKYVL